VDQDAIIQYITQTFEGLDILRPNDGPGAGDTFFYYDPLRDIDPSKRLPFATIVVKNYGEFDHLSQLDRPDVFRLNIGVTRETFVKLTGHPPTEDATSAVGYDFAALDRLMPHPVYAPQSWLCVLNPTAETFEEIKPLLVEAYSRQRADVERRAG
jgi:Family of unknown function (DUF6194)